MSMYKVFPCFVGRGYFLWPVHSLGKTLLAFALLHSVLQGQICLLLQVFLDFLLLHSSISQSLLKLMSIEWMMLSKHLIFCYPLLLLPSLFPASESFPLSQLFSSGGQKYWSSSISPSNEYLELISFSIDWFDLLAVQGTLKNLIQHHNSKASVLWCSVSFMVQLSYPYMTIGKTIALTIQTFVGRDASAF